MDVDTTTMARAIGWFSIGLGVAGLVAPARVGNMLGTGERRTLACALATRDLVIGSGLVSRADPSPWMRARLVAEGSDTVMLAVGALTGTFPRPRAVRGAIAAGGLGAVDCWLVHKLRDE